MSMKVRYRVDFGGGARGGRRDAVDAPDVGAEPDQAPAALDPEAAPQPQRVTRAARMLALAHHVERLVEAGELAGYAEAARALGVTRARLTQVMNLLLLSPKVQEELFAGKLRMSERALRCVVATPKWSTQQRLLLLRRHLSPSSSKGTQHP